MNWSHQFNDGWSIKQRFVADLMDTVQGWTSGVDLNTDNTLNRSFVLAPSQSNTYFTTLDLTGRFETGVLKHTVLAGAITTAPIIKPAITDLIWQRSIFITPYIIPR